MLFNFFIIPNKFLKSCSIWLEILSELEVRRCCFQSEPLLNMKKVTGSGCRHSNPHGLHDWNLLPTKYSFYWQKVRPQTVKDAQAVPKKMAFSHYLEHPPLKPALRCMVFTLNIWQHQQMHSCWRAKQNTGISPLYTHL